MKYLLLAVLLLVAGPLMAADLANGQRISKSCALCHGVYGQGTSGRLSPRIAGLPKEYILKSMEDYIKGTRKYSLMVYTSHVDTMSDKDKDDIASYYASLDLASDVRFDVRARIGDAAKGKAIYKADCDGCHARDGYGKPKKEAPPLAGQHPEYLYTVMRGFREKYRVHANDPEDDSFNEYSDQEYIDMTAYLAGLDDPKIVDGYRMALPRYDMPARRTAERSSAIQITDIVQTVVRMPIEAGVDPDAAEAAMLAKAEEIGMKKVAQQRVSDYLAKQGVDAPHLAIFQFCNPMDARTMVIANPIFSSYMPCRISMVADKDGKMWLMMLNLDMLINSELLPTEVIETAVRVNQQMLDIMAAGARGKSS